MTAIDLRGKLPTQLNGHTDPKLLELTRFQQRMQVHYMTDGLALFNSLYVKETLAEDKVRMG